MRNKRTSDYSKLLLRQKNTKQRKLGVRTSSPTLSFTKQMILVHVTAGHIFKGDRPLNSL